MNNLREKILNTNCPLIFYELLPPTCINHADVEAYVQCAIELITHSPIKIDAINIPDIQYEKPKESNDSPVYLPKIDSHVFADILEKASYQRIKVILNRVVVYEPLEKQLQWIKKITQRHKDNIIIIVGGTTNKINYPGPSVLALSNHIKNTYSHDEVFCGGITIQSRRSLDKVNDEPYRLLAKAKNGIEFFTSQIIYDSEGVKQLLWDYAQTCEKEKVQPKRIFLSFAPIASHKDLDFLRWLGAIIPKSIETQLFKTTIGIGWRSAEVAATILKDILHFVQQEQIPIPLGLNIEYVTRHNFELSFQLVERLGKLYHNNYGR
jgi:hypothetical protein